MDGAGDYVLDLNKDEVIVFLVALDTELGQLQRLCLEQGPFFRVLFVEGVSDGERFGLKEHALRNAAHAPHCSREYWKKVIPVSDVQNVERKVGRLMARWRALYPRLTDAIMWPGVDKAASVSAGGTGRARAAPASGLTVLDAELRALEASILELCAHLLGAGCRVPLSRGSAGVASAGVASEARLAALLGRLNGRLSV
jgi:hypothetical protein